MRLHRIEVDDEVLAFLKSRAEGFNETPNSVLRRELLGRNGAPVATEAREASGLPEFPFGTPAALEQVLWVIFGVKERRRSRPEATSWIAKQIGVAPQTVLDKYCRQLGLTADRFDVLIREPGLKRLRELLVQKHGAHRASVERFFDNLSDGT